MSGYSHTFHACEDFESSDASYFFRLGLPIFGNPYQCLHSVLLVKLSTATEEAVNCGNGVEDLDASDFKSARDGTMTSMTQQHKPNYDSIELSKSYMDPVIGRSSSPSLAAHVYSNGKVQTNRSMTGNGLICSAFLANIDEHKYASVWIFGKSYNLPPWSVSILPDCENVAFNTAHLRQAEQACLPHQVAMQAEVSLEVRSNIVSVFSWRLFLVGAQTSVFTFESGSPSHSSRHKPSLLLPGVDGSYFSSTWWTSKEIIGTWGGESFATQGILEHLNVTKDTSDYLWYTTSVNISDEDVGFWSSKGVLPALKIDQIRDVARVFVNGELAGSQVGHWVSLKQPVQFVQGLNKLTLLSEIVGLQNYGAFLEKDGAGFRGQVKLTGLPNGDIDLTHSVWTYQVGLKGEFSMIYAPEKQACAEWSGMQIDDILSPFTWYKTMFDAPKGTDPVAIYLGSMGKGQAWVNGHLIGRYWSLVAPESGCSSSCNYPGAYSESKCQSNCGMPTQSWYHIPREWLQESDNLLVLFEETGGDPSKISLEVHYTKTICSRISESYYPPLSAWSRLTSGRVLVDTIAPELRLRCDDGHLITKITFASYGTPSGGCQNFSEGKCHASSTLALVSEACVGNNECAISVSNDVFGDPCRGVLKDLAVEAECSLSSATKEPRDEM
ncbi:Beta-galactosidase 15 [Triticum urartu]|uniref:beta-galactosidase n=1 Tax=Triticum urartu TaxID=4572 RepID=M7ZA20_TRIUA|nr:Beta-galactosidase 15 [Triticum urartu]